MLHSSEGMSKQSSADRSPRLLTGYQVSSLKECVCVYVSVCACAYTCVCLCVYMCVLYANKNFRLSSALLKESCWYILSQVRSQVA